MTRTYLTRTQVAELYPISVHTLAKLASDGKGPRFYKPTDKCLYRAEDIEAWIEAAAVTPTPQVATTSSQHRVRTTAPSGCGRALPKPGPTKSEPSRRSGRKSLPPSPNSFLLRPQD
jgi:Helix-turn-helix domain